jgi:hypothetical protein
MILFIPIAGVVKIILESMEKQGIYAIFFSELPKRPKPDGVVVKPKTKIKK